MRKKKNMHKEKETFTHTYSMHAHTIAYKHMQAHTNDQIKKED